MNASAITVISKYRNAYKKAMEEKDTDAIFLMHVYNEILKISKNRKIETDMQLKADIIGKLYQIKRNLQNCLQNAIEEKDEFQITCMKQNLKIMESI
jgi:hypothetical protein